MQVPIRMMFRQAMIDTTPSISVIICAYSHDRWDSLLSAIQSVRMQTLRAGEIIVVIDHNQDLLGRLQAQLEGVTVIANAEARGLSGARNSGVMTSSGRVVAFLDDDAVAAPNWLEQLHAGYHDSRVLGVGGPVEPVWLDGRPAWFPEEFDWVVGCTFRGMPARPSSVRALIGCNMSFRREVFDALGGFRRGIGRVGARPIAGEETEFCIRANQRFPHSVWLYQPQASVYHAVPATRASLRYFRARCYAEGLSKVLIARSVGSADGLAAERTYTLRTLPAGAARGVFELLSHGDVFGLARSGAIVAGLSITAAGYARGLASQPLPSHDRYQSDPPPPRSLGSETADRHGVGPSATRPVAGSHRS